MAARAFGEEGVAGVQLHPRLVVGLWVPSRATPMSPVATPFTAAVVVEQDFGGGEAGENLDPQFLGLRRQASG